MSSRKTAPSLRFRGFGEPWEEKNAAILADYSKGNGYSKSDLTKTGIPIILYGRLYTKYEFVINDVDTFTIPKRGSVYSQGNEVIIPASGETAEDIARAAAIEKPGILLGGDLNILRPFDFINPLFLALAISNGKPQKDLIKKAQGKSVVHIHNSDIQGIILTYPSKIEQNRIVEVFRNLDRLIALEQQKYDKLNTVKKSMLEKMFPQKGAKVPEIRFKGFSEPWEEKKLGDVGTITTGNTPSTSISGYYSEDGILWVTPTDIIENITFQSTRKLSKLGQQVARVVPKHTILVTCIASIGKNTMLGTNGCFNQQINGLTPDEDKYDSYFLLTESYLWSSQMKTFAASGTMQIVNKTEFSELKTLIPNLKEQQAIGSYFQNLDRLITSQGRKIEKLRNLKKACLEKMFV